MKTVDKDLLDMEKVRADLLFNLKGKLAIHLLFPPILAVLVGIVHLACATEYANYFPEAVLHRVIPLLWLIPAGYLAGFGAYVLRKWLWIRKTQFSVATDAFCWAKEVMRSRGSYISPLLKHLEIHFSEHGVFKTLSTHATWSSKGNRMGCTDLANNSAVGDTFYLILDERVKEGRKPKILLAYPCKYFVWMENA